MDNHWQLQDAKSRFSEVVDRALTRGVQVITRRGRKTAVILSFDDYESLTGRDGSLADFFKKSPLVGSELEVGRDKTLPRKLDLEP